MDIFRFSPIFAVLLFVLCGTVVSPLHAQTLSPKAVGHIQANGVSSKVMRASQRAVQGPDRAGKDGPLAKIGQELALLYHQHRAEGAGGVRRLREETPVQKRGGGDDESGPLRSRSLSPISADGRLVTIEATAAEGATDALLADLRRLGLENGLGAGRLVAGQLPISALREAAQLSTLRGMRPSLARVHAGRVESEADTAHGTHTVRREMELDGSGQKICALSDSYNRSGIVDTQAEQDIRSGDLPGTGNPDGRTLPVDVLDDSYRGGDEGRAMLQLIHDIAPGAELGFHTAAGNGLVGFAAGIRALADPTRGNCDILVDDIGFNTEPFYQDGPVTSAVDEVVEQHDVVYFAAAGNDGHNAYRAPFRNSGNPGVISPEQSVAHDFDPGSAVDTLQQITILPGGRFGFFTFQWTDPSVVVEGSSGPDTDIDVALVNDTSGIVAESLLDNVADGRPVEALQWRNDGTVDIDEDGEADSTFHLVIEKYSGPDPEEVRYIYSGVGYSIDEYNTRGATIYGHPMAEKGRAVAAAPFVYTSAYSSAANPAFLEDFSSKGGIPLRFDRSGTPISPVNRDTPDYTGADGIDNTFFGNDLSDTAFGGVDSDSYPNFFGTSAAAPNIAAIAALIREARPTYSHEEVYAQLRSGAADVTQRLDGAGGLMQIGDGRDPWSGHGFVRAEAAVPPLDVFDLQLVQAGSSTGGNVVLSWKVRSGVTIQQYDFERRYFSEAFEPLDVSVNDESVIFEELGLGTYTFRVQWTRQDGVTGRQVLTDTLGFQGVTAEVAGTRQDGRGTVALSWSVPPGTEGFTYRVERRIEGASERPFRTIRTTEDTQFEHPRQMPGSYAYRVTAVDDRGNALTSSEKTVDVELDGAVAAVGPYPNPVRGDAVTVDLTVENTQRVTVEVFNTLGERMYRAERRVEALAPEVLRLDVEEWASGVYFFRMRGEEFSNTRKFVVVK